jgi:hypothetical protein
MILNLPPDIGTRAIALQTAATILGKAGAVQNPAHTYPSDALKQLTQQLVWFIRTGAWPGEPVEEDDTLGKGDPV